MNARDFVYWLQGYAEIHGGTPTDREWQVILDHLAIVENTPKTEPLSASVLSITPQLGQPTMYCGHAAPETVNQLITC